jgi:hypothetical protein
MGAKKYKISFCIVCMNRLHHLKETLLQNIFDNQDYSGLQFIILDYNSQDKMEDWIKDTLSQYIAMGRIVYYKTLEPNLWNPSHSKNLAFKLAEGEIVCVINADHFTGAKFAVYINNAFNKDSNIVMTPIDFYKTKKNHPPPGDVLGRVCVKKSDFLRIKGFDERMDRYGFEDYDFINRLELIDVKRFLIEDFSFLKFIPHENRERYSLPDNLYRIYINHQTPSLSELILLYVNHRFEKGVIVDNSTKDAEDYTYAYKTRDYHFEHILKESHWETGIWKETENESVHFLSECGNEFIYLKSLQKQHNLLQDTMSGLYFFNVINNELIKDIMTFNHYIYTRAIMENNLELKIAAVNSDDFGKATVFKNFQPRPISV